MELGDILEAYGPMLARIVASFEADPALQQDLLQDVSLALWQALPSFRGDGQIKAFVAKVAQNRCLTHVAKEMRVPKPVEISEQIQGGGPSVEVVLADKQQRQMLIQAVRKLPLTLRQVTTLALEGFGPKEIAGMTGITDTNVSVRLGRAKKRLKELLAEMPARQG